MNESTQHHESHEELIRYENVTLQIPDGEHNMFRMAQLIVDATHNGEKVGISVCMREKSGGREVVHKLMQISKAGPKLEYMKPGESLHFTLSGLPDDMKKSADAIRRQLEEAVQA